MKKTNESGRSMVEMLGVLAIIGVLTAGGLGGYTLAMNKIRTTRIAERIQMVVTEADVSGETKTYTGTFGEMDNMIKTILTEITANPGTNTVTITPSNTETACKIGANDTGPCKDAVSQLKSAGSIAHYTIVVAGDKEDMNNKDNNNNNGGE